MSEKPHSVGFSRLKYKVLLPNHKYEFEIRINDSLPDFIVEVIPRYEISYVVNMLDIYKYIETTFIYSNNSNNVRGVVLDADQECLWICNSDEADKLVDYIETWISERQICIKNGTWKGV